MRDPRFFPPQGVCERTCEFMTEVVQSDTMTQTQTAEIEYRRELFRDCVAQSGCVSAPHSESGRLAIKNAINQEAANNAIRTALVDVRGTE